MGLGAGLSEGLFCSGGELRCVGIERNPPHHHPNPLHTPHHATTTSCVGRRTFAFLNRQPQLTRSTVPPATQASTAPISNDHDRPAYDPNVVHARDSAISCLADVNKPPTHKMGPFKDWTPPAKE